jgi:hypothetical protein
MRVRLCALLAVYLLLTAVGGAIGAVQRPRLTPPGGAAGAGPGVPSSHVVTIVMENKEAGMVLGTPGMPYVKRLARRYGVAMKSYAVTHPSLPNYLALVGGSTFGITSNCTRCHTRASSIVDQLEGRAISWRAYMEGAPAACYRRSFSRRGYAKKHNPFLYFDRISTDSARCRQVVPLRRLDGDLRNGRLPTYTWISPGLCHDTHNCSRAVGDRFLAGLVPRLLPALGPDGFLVLTWDEGSTDTGCCGAGAGGRIATVVAGPDVRRGARLASPLTHYGVLATVQGALGLPPLRAAADPAHGSLLPLFRHPPRIA